jgi:hypothetical protein
MKQQSDPEYMQQVTLYFGGIEKAGVLIGEKATRPCLVLTSDTHPFLSAVVKSDAAVVKEMHRFIEWTSAAWEKGDKQKPINVVEGEELKRRLAQNKDVPTFNSHRNVPITLMRKAEGGDSNCCLSVIFPSKEMLAMGSGQPKIIISQTAESNSRIDEILNEMAAWVTARLATMVAGA